LDLEPANLIGNFTLTWKNHVDFVRATSQTVLLEIWGMPLEVTGCGRLSGSCIDLIRDEGALNKKNILRGIKIGIISESISRSRKLSLPPLEPLDRKGVIESTPGVDQVWKDGERTGQARSFFT